MCKYIHTYTHIYLKDISTTVVNIHHCRPGMRYGWTAVLAEVNYQCPNRPAGVMYG